MEIMNVCQKSFKIKMNSIGFSDANFCQLRRVQVFENMAKSNKIDFSTKSKQMFLKRIIFLKNL